MKDLYSVGRNGVINPFFLPKGQEFETFDPTERMQMLTVLMLIVSIITLAVLYFRLRI